MNWGSSCPQTLSPLKTPRLRFLKPKLCLVRAGMWSLGPEAQTGMKENTVLEDLHSWHCAMGIPLYPLYRSEN